MAKEINWNTVLIVLIVGVVGILLLSNGNFLSGAFSKDVTGFVVSGTGTINKVVKWKDASGGLMDSSIYSDSNGNVGIGTMDIQGRKLRVNGNVMIDGLQTNSNIYLLNLQDYSTKQPLARYLCLDGYNRVYKSSVSCV